MGFFDSYKYIILLTSFWWWLPDGVELYFNLRVYFKDWGWEEGLKVTDESSKGLGKGNAFYLFFFFFSKVKISQLLPNK